MHQAHQVRPDTRVKELGAAKWLVQRNLFPAIPHFVLSDLSRGLRRLPKPKTSKALPVSKKLLHHMLAKPGIPYEVKILMTLAFVTASRIDETSRCVNMEVDGVRLIIFRTSKTNQEAAARADHLTIIGTSTILKPFLALSPARQEAVLKAGTSQIDATLAAIEIPDQYVQFWQKLDPMNVVKAHLTRHSFKRGAAFYLWTAASKNQITVEQVAHALKHKSLQSSLAYAPSPTTVAKAYNTQKVQQVLKL